MAPSCVCLNCRYSYMLLVFGGGPTELDKIFPFDLHINLIGLTLGLGGCQSSHPYIFFFFFKQCFLPLFFFVSHWCWGLWRTYLTVADD